MRRHPLLIACIAALALAGCKPPATDTAATASVSTTAAETQIPASSDYAVVPLKADLSGFDENGKRMIALLVQAAQVMDTCTGSSPGTATARPCCSARPMPAPATSSP